MLSNIFLEQKMQISKNTLHFRNSSGPLKSAFFCQKKS